jgi:hypothetical protein
MERTSLTGLSYEQKRDRFEYFLMVYKTTNACMSDSARAAKLKPDTASRWFDKWVKGQIFTEVVR